MEATSVWKVTTPNHLTFHALHGKLSADVVIVGGGIIGLTTAYLLQKAGKKVILLEAMRIGDGTTGYSTCHLNTDSDFGYKILIQSFGIEVGKLVADSRKEGINSYTKPIEIAEN